MGNVDNGGLAPEAKYRQLQQGPWKKTHAKTEYKALTAGEVYAIDEAYDKLVVDREKEQAAVKAAADKYYEDEKSRKQKDEEKYAGRKTGKQ